MFSGGGRERERGEESCYRKTHSEPIKSALEEREES